jgi:TM2 domain-containing membrane protein YozV
MKTNDYSIDAQRQLSEKDLIIYNTELQKGRKSVLVAYLLFLFASPLGLHNFYIGKIRWGIAYFILATLGYVFGIVIIFSEHGNWEPSAFIIILFCSFGILWLIDLFTLASQIDELEASRSKKLLAQFGIINKQEPKDKAEPNKDLVQKEINYLKPFVPFDRNIDDIKQ